VRLASSPTFIPPDSTTTMSVVSTKVIMQQGYALTLREDQVRGKPAE
jgi:hypothetical protein